MSVAGLVSRGRRAAWAALPLLLPGPIGAQGVSWLWGREFQRTTAERSLDMRMCRQDDGSWKIYATP